MILIDLGNTNAKIYQDNQLLKINSEGIFEYLDQVTKPVLLCSVVPRLNRQIRVLYPNVNIISNHDYKLIFDNYQDLETKGTDRILGCLAAVKLYGAKVVVVDIGTCVTIDVIDDRQYLSGFIYPGFAMLENLLSEKIEQLPLPLKAEQKISTDSQIYWANIYGFIGAIKSMLDRCIPDLSYKLVLTGGSIAKFKEEYDFDLVTELAVHQPIYKKDLIYQGLIEFANIKK